MQDYSNKLLYLLIIILLFANCDDVTKSKKIEDNQPSTIVELYGQLQVEGNKITDQNGEAISLHGMSLFWSQWIDKYYNKNAIQWLKDDWKCTIIRVPLGVEPDGYLENPIQELNKVKTAVEACIDLGLYVIIDWHDHNAHEHTEDAKIFFKQMAILYGEYPNVIYEIYNEPENCSWSQDVKPYAEEIISAIREHDSDNLITVGSPHWAQDVDIATADPIEDPNLAYSLHFYAAAHKQELRNKAAIALSRGFALFVNEFGICDYTGDGDIDQQSTNEWMNFMDNMKISWCKWSVADKDEGDAVLEENADPDGGWTDNDLKPSGKLIRQLIIDRNQKIYNQLNIDN